MATRHRVRNSERIHTPNGTAPAPNQHPSRTLSRFRAPRTRFPRGERFRLSCPLRTPSPFFESQLRSMFQQELPGPQQTMEAAR